MKTIWCLTISHQGRPDDVRYFFNRKAAESSRDSEHWSYLMCHLMTANGIKGGIRGRGRAKMDRLAHGIVAERRTYTITQHDIRGGLEEESQ